MTEQEFIDFIHSVGDEYSLRACILMLAKKPKQRQQLVDFIKENNLSCHDVIDNLQDYDNYIIILNQTKKLFVEGGGVIHKVDED